MAGHNKENALYTCATLSMNKLHESLKGKDPLSNRKDESQIRRKYPPYIFLIRYQKNNVQSKCENMADK